MQGRRLVEADKEGNGENIPAGEVGGEAKCRRGEDSSPEQQDPASSKLLRAVEELPVDEVDVEEEGGHKGGEEEGEAGKL